MPMRICCQTKGCYKETEAYLDLDTNKVFCAECDNEIPNITSFTKQQLKNLKQYKVKEKVAYSVKCKSCSKDLLPIVIKDKLACPVCKSEHKHLSVPFALLIKSKIHDKDE